MKTKTFKQAKLELMAYLENNGWQVSRDLKIPHATKGDTRLYFKTQAIYSATGYDLSFGSARSLHLDIRTVAPDTLVICLGMIKPAKVNYA